MGHADGLPPGAGRTAGTRAGSARTYPIGTEGAAVKPSSVQLHTRVSWPRLEIRRRLPVVRVQGATGAPHGKGFPMVTTYEQLAEAAYETAFNMGREHGKRDVAEGTLNHTPLSGEWADDPTPASVRERVLEALGVDPESVDGQHGFPEDYIADEYESGYWAAHADAHPAA